MVLLDPYSIFVSRGENYVVYGIVVGSSQACGELLELFTQEDLGWDCGEVGLLPDYFVGDPGVKGCFDTYHSSAV